MTEKDLLLYKNGTEENFQLFVDCLLGLCAVHISDGDKLVKVCVAVPVVGIEPELSIEALKAAPGDAKGGKKGSRSVCFHFEKGKCQRGNQCKFFHDKSFEAHGKMCFLCGARNESFHMAADCSVVKVVGALGENKGGKGPVFGKGQGQLFR